MTEEFIKDNYKTGDSFTARIRDEEIEGKISICKEKGEKTIKVFFCSDNDNASGSTAEDKLGYKRSWLYDGNITDIIIIPAKKPEEIINTYSIY